MNVARILKDKGRDVFTTQPHRTLREVASMLASKGVGAAVNETQPVATRGASLAAG